jgi:MFS family permease
MPVLTTQRTFGSFYTLGFFFALAIALPAYVNSAFLSQFIAPQSVGIIYSTASVITLLLFLNIGSLLKKYGNFRLSMVLSGTALVSLLAMGLLKSPILITAFFIAFDVSLVLLFFCVDVFLETFLSDNVTGTVRGTFLSIASTAWIIAPVLAGLIISTNNYWKVYLVSATVLIPVILIIISVFSRFKDPDYDKMSIFEIIEAIPSHKSTTKILASNFILQFFYAWMIIYTPIYLITKMGFDWPTLGIMFTIMLIPFAVLEAPLGRLADERWGEKEMLSVGFIIMGLATILLAFIPVPNFWLWTLALLATRIGASTVEIMNETYFFKKIGDSQPDMVSLFRMTKPLAFIIAPMIATVLLLFLPFYSLFIILGFIVLIGLRFSLTLKDTL